jgi:hypothetical protein
MSFHELAAALQRTAQKAQQAGRLGPKQYGFVDDARREATPYAIDVIGLNDDAIGWARYAQEFQERREWCAEWCRNDWDIEPLRDTRMRLIGRRFRFANKVEAVYFKLRFDTNLR